MSIASEAPELPGTSPAGPAATTGTREPRSNTVVREVDSAGAEDVER